MAKKIINWMDDIDDNSVQKSLDAGIILPRLKPRLNQVYQVEIISELNSFESNFGITFTVDIKHDNMEKSLILPKSFRFQLIVDMKRKGLVNKEGNADFKQLIGKTILFQKTLGDTKQFKNAELYSCQVK